VAGAEVSTEEQQSLVTRARRRLGDGHVAGARGEQSLTARGKHGRGKLGGDRFLNLPRKRLEDERHAGGVGIDRLRFAAGGRFLFVERRPTDPYPGWGTLRRGSRGCSGFGFIRPPAAIERTDD
jgi:hypothetical protein